jgi:hypothetical protein
MSSTERQSNFRRDPRVIAQQGQVGLEGPAVGQFRQAGEQEG